MKNWNGVKVKDILFEEIVEHISVSARSGGIGMGHLFWSCDDSIDWGF